MTPLRDVRKLDPGERLVIEDGELRRERYWSYPAPAPGPGRAQPGRVGRDRARQARRVGRHAADERRAARRHAQRRARLEPDRRADGAPHGPAGQDVLGRLRRRGLRAARRAPDRRVQRRRPPRARGGALDRRGRADAARLAPGRAARRSLGRRLPRALRAGRLEGHRRALRPGRRRAARRLPQAPRGVAGRALGRRPAARSAPRPRSRCGTARAARASCSTRSSRAIPSRACWRRAGSCTRTCAPGSSRARWPSRPTPPSASCAATSPGRRVRRRSRARCTSTPSSASSTTCSPTSTARRWRARSRSACRSSTTSSSSCAPRSRPTSRSAGSRASTCCGARPRVSSRTSCSSARSAASSTSRSAPGCTAEASSSACCSRPTPRTHA